MPTGACDESSYSSVCKLSNNGHDVVSASVVFREVRVQFHHARILHFLSRERMTAKERGIHRADLIFPHSYGLRARRLVSVSCSEVLGGMVVESDVEDGDVRVLKLQALFSHRKRSVSNGQQLLFVQQQVSFIEDRPFVFARHA